MSEVHSSHLRTLFQRTIKTDVPKSCGTPTTIKLFHRSNVAGLACSVKVIPANAIFTE
jgi:hypothetical protein